MNSKIFRRDDPFHLIKRKVYLYTLPFILLAVVIAMWMESRESDFDLLNLITLPFLFVWLFIFLLIGILKEKWIPIFEATTFILLLLFHLTRFYFVLESSTGYETYSLDEYALWVPLFFIYIFLIFKRKQALIISITVYLMTVFMGVYLLFIDHDHYIAGLDHYLQIYVSNIVYIVCLFTLLSTVQIFNRTILFEEMANTDFLTKLFNRRKMSEVLDLQIKNSRKFNRPLTAILIDIDFFKEVNDQFGHEAGDSVLKEFAKLIRQNTRKTDYFARWGGEEFLILATDQDQHQAKEFAERMRKVIANHKFKHVSDPITASFGITELTGEDDTSSFVNRADQLLYVSKEKGRNRVTLAENPAI